MFTFTLPTGETITIDTEDVPLLDVRWNRHTSHYQRGYIVARTAKRTNLTCGQELLHRAVMSRALERRLSPHELVDHIDGDTTNNRRNNLRLATHKGNSRNRALHRNNKTGVPGVFVAYTKKGIPRYRLYIAGKYLGTFNTQEEAKQARIQAEAQLHGEFAAHLCREGIYE